MATINGLKCDPCPFVIISTFVILLWIFWNSSPIAMNITFVSRPNPNSSLHISCCNHELLCYMSHTKISFQTHFSGVRKLAVHTTSYPAPNRNSDVISKFGNPNSLNLSTEFLNKEHNLLHPISCLMWWISCCRRAWKLACFSCTTQNSLFSP